MSRAAALRDFLLVVLVCLALLALIGWRQPASSEAPNDAASPADSGRHSQPRASPPRRECQHRCRQLPASREAPYPAGPQDSSGGAPSPTGEVGTALVGGWATYWDTCERCAAAGPLLREALGPGWQGKTVRVVSDVGEVDVRLVTSCACGERTRDGVTRPTIIDVSVEAFDELSPAPAGSAADPGYIRVSIEIPGGPTLPPTDLPPHPDDERMRREVREDGLYR